MFFVVEFSNGSVEVVPDNWLCADGKFCYWPNFSKSKMHIAIQNKTQPDENWKKSDIERVMRKCGMLLYISARNANIFSVVKYRHTQTNTHTQNVNV